MNSFNICIPKLGCLPKECEDASTVNLNTLRFCVCDGASDSFDSRTWAWLLAAEWKNSRAGSLLDFESLSNVLGRLAEKWNAKWSSKILPWYKEEKQKLGAYTAFLGIELKAHEGKIYWNAISIGDCCLFIIDGGSLISTSFPFSSEEQFNNYPFLISTNKEKSSSNENHFIQESGYFSQESSFLLMTDAISAWYLRTLKFDPQKNIYFSFLLSTHDSISLKEFISNERNANTLRNDDIAIIFFKYD